MSTLLPQLPDSSALPLMAEMSRCSDPSSLDPGSELRSSQAYVMPTGGLPVKEATLKLLRDKIVEAAVHHGFPEKRPRSFLAFELQVAQILAVWDPFWINGVPSGESLRNNCWTFLTVVVLPDVAFWRWPASSEGETDKAWKGRMLGGGRNTFQRIYRRVLSLDRGPSHPDRWGLIRELREDDFSNILERPSLGSNPNVAVCLAEEYLAMRERLSSASAAIQTRVYREATKDLRSYGVVQSLDLLPRADLETLIRKTFFHREEMHLPRCKATISSDSPHPDERTEPGSVEAYPPPPYDSSPEQGVSSPTLSPPTSRSQGLLRRLLGGG